MEKWIEIKDSACYNLTEIMENENCSYDRAIEIAFRYFSEREPDFEEFEE